MRSSFCLIVVLFLCGSARAVLVDKLSDGDLFESSDMRKKTPVLIYIGNDDYAPFDSPFDQNKKAFREKISELAKTSKQKEVFQNIAAKFVDLIAWHHSPFTGEVRLLEKICHEGLNRDRFAVVIIRNFGNDTTAWSDPAIYQFWRPFNYITCSEKKDSPTYAPSLEIGYFKDFRSEAQPLSSPKTLNVLLRDVEKRFPQDSYRYLLWIRSVGGIESPARPQLDFDAAKIDTAEMEKRILANPYFTDPKSLGASWTQQGLEFFAQLNASLSDSSAGMRKIDVLRVLENYGGRDPMQGMFFPVVYLDAPFSDLRLSQEKEISELIKKSGKLEVLDVRSIGRLVTHDANESKLSVSRTLAPLLERCDPKEKSCDIGDLFIEAVSK